MRTITWKYLVCSMAITDLADLDRNGSIPEDWMFTVKNGKVLYNEVGSAWRERSENTVYLSHKDDSKYPQRWFHPDTVVEIYKVH